MASEYTGATYPNSVGGREQCLVDLSAILTVAYLGLQAQGWAKSTDYDDRSCRYRGFEGRKCAVGHLIPNELYSDDFEGIGVPIWEDQDGLFGDALRTVLAKIGIAPHDFDFVQRMQSRHDDATNSPVLLREAFEDFADDYSLAIPPQPR